MADDSPQEPKVTPSRACGPLSYLHANNFSGHDQFDAAILLAPCSSVIAGNRQSVTIALAGDAVWSELCLS
jgi:hypothetical protein